MLNDVYEICEVLSPNLLYDMESHSNNFDKCVALFIETRVV